MVYSATDAVMQGCIACISTSTDVLRVTVLIVCDHHHCSGDGTGALDNCCGGGATPHPFRENFFLRQVPPALKIHSYLMVTTYVYHFIQLLSNRSVTWSLLSKRQWRVMESDSRDEKDRGREPEKVLIEREGKFELVNACEVQAAGDMSAERELEPGSGVVQPAATDHEASPGSHGDSREQLNVLALNSDHESDKSNLEAAGYPLNSDHHDPPEIVQEEVPTKSTMSEPSPPMVDGTSGATSQGEPVDCDVKPSGEQPGGLKSGSRVQIAAADHLPKSTASPKISGTGKDLSSISATSLRPRDGSKWKQNASRVQSAPGSRSASKRKQELEDAEKMRAKQEMNEVAFAAWLSRKNEERRKLEKPKNQMSDEDLRLKRQRNKEAFQAWVASKERELQERRKDSAPSTSAPQCSKEMSSAAFEGWVSSKREQRRREAGLEDRRKKELEEAAKRVDSTVVDQSYKK